LHTLAFDLGNSYFSLGEFETALKHYDRAIELNNTYSNYYFNRAITEFNLGFPEDACADFSNAKDLGDTEAIGYIKELCK
jgi:tetratricopeptide (TPR) repeat protein